MTKFQVGDRGHARGESYFGKDLSGILLEVYSTTTIAGDGYIGVKEVNGKGSYVIRNSQFCVTQPTKPTKNQRISALEDKVAKLEKVVAELTNRRPLKPNLALLEEVKKKLGVESVQSVQNQSNNQKRAAIIEKAKRFVEDCRIEYRGFEFKFYPNAKKRAVVALVYGKGDGYLLYKSIAKCHPHDVFNEHIGKAIALGRALCSDVSEFEQAVQPDEVVIGMEVATTRDYPESVDGPVRKGDVFKIVDSVNDFNKEAQLGSGISENCRITNDTNAQYEEVK